MKKLLWLFLLAVTPLSAQIYNPTIIFTTTAPTGACGDAPPIYIVSSTGSGYGCISGTYSQLWTGGGGGTGFPFTLGSTAIAASSTTTAFAGLTALGMTSAGVVSWSSDTGVSRCSADLVCFGNGASGDHSANLSGAGLTLSGSATIGAANGLVWQSSTKLLAPSNGVLSITPNSAGPAEITQGLFSAAGTPLPTCTSGIRGYMAVVSDATTPTYLVVYVSGGAITAGVLCNGTAWVTH